MLSDLDKGKDTAVGYSTSNNRRSEWHPDCLAESALPMNISTTCISLFWCQETVSPSRQAPGQLHFLIKAGAAWSWISANPDFIDTVIAHLKRDA